MGASASISTKEEEMKFKFGTPYPIDTIPDTYKVAEYTWGPRVMLHVPGTMHNEGFWSFGHWDADPYARRPRPYWSMETFNAITESRSRQPDMWMPCPGEEEGGDDA